MQITKKLIVFSVLVLASFCVKAQSLLDLNDLSETKIESYSDEELKSFYEKAMESGMTEAQLYRLALEKGLSEKELMKLKTRIQGIDFSTVKKKVADKSGGEDDNTLDGEKDIQHKYDTLKNKPLAKDYESDLEIFGAELFTKNSTVFEPNLRIPTPSGYVIGPDDELILNVFGYSEKTYSLKVTEEGTVYIQNVGPVNVNGLTIEQATERIKTKLSASIYKAIRSGQTKVQLTLGKIRSIRVTVIGEAKKPGTYTVSSLTTLYNILYLCGGPSNMGSYRTIEVVRGGVVKCKTDLYAFLVKGNQKDNILLQEGDVVRIPYYQSRVSITGEVKRKGKFEMLEKETFANLLQYCGGFTDNAYKGSVSVERISDKERTMVDLTQANFSSFAPKGSDKYTVGKLLDRYENRIFITGSVFRPGAYQLSDKLTVKQLIEKAGGVTEDAFASRATIFRTNDDKTPTTLSVNIDSVLRFGADVLLKKDDSVSVYSIFDFKEKYVVKVDGQVKRAGEFKWRENLSVKDLLVSIGGLTTFGDSTNIEVARRIKDADVTQKDYAQTEIFVINLKNNQDIVLQPYDIILVKNLPGYAEQRKVVIQGEVLSPGVYSLSKSGEKISELFKRVGGFKATADTASVTIRRYIKNELTTEEREKIFKRVLNLNQDSLTTNDRLKTEVYKTYDLISINLGLALANPDRPENLTLEDGDIITIDRNTNLVRVSGEVYFPTVVPFDKHQKLKSYIKRAGNYTANARKVRTMVIYPDGKVRTVRRFLFFKSYPPVTARSEVFVPQKSTKNRTRINTGEWALIVSALGIVANTIIASKR